MSAPSAPAPGTPEKVVLVAEPKLRKVDKLMVNDDDREYISQWAHKGYWRGGLTGTAVALVSGGLMMRRISTSSAVILGSACGVLTGLFATASVLPQAMRQGILTLPNNSPLKMSLFHVVQQLNSDLSPSQIYTMVHRHERLAGRPTEPSAAAAAASSSPASAEAGSSQ